MKGANGLALLIAELAVSVLLAAPLFAQDGDARLGARTLQETQCTLCHPVLGIGGTDAPDLGRRFLQPVSAASMAGMMWTHGPVMWRQMAGWNLEVPVLTNSDARNLYAYFYSLRYFDPLGDASPGQSAFVDKSCNRCHALVATDAGALGPPVPQWLAIADRVLWLQHMWNHGGEMAADMENQGVAWPHFTVQEMADLMVFVQEVPGVPPRPPSLAFRDALEGSSLFSDRGCSACHTMGKPDPKKIDLLARAEGSTLTSLAVAMWNHRPLMASARETDQLEWKPFQGEEMAHLLSYLLEQRYVEPQGDSARGEGIFAAKSCAACHEKSVLGAPALPRGDAKYTVYQFAADAWRHGPIMDANLDALGVDWPRLTEREVADLVAFLDRR